MYASHLRSNRLPSFSHPDYRNYSNVSNPDNVLFGEFFPECRSLWDHFKRVLALYPENNFCGTRDTGDSPYTWISYA